MMMPAGREIKLRGIRRCVSHAVVVHGGKGGVALMVLLSQRAAGAVIGEAVLLAHDDHGVAAKVEFESEFESSLSHFSFKRLVPGDFNVGLIGSTCTALPRGPRT
jgi:hypothetical protein